MAAYWLALDMRVYDRHAYVDHLTCYGVFGKWSTPTAEALSVARWLLIIRGVGFPRGSTIVSWSFRPAGGFNVLLRPCLLYVGFMVSTSLADWSRKRRGCHSTAR